MNIATVSDNFVKQLAAVTAGTPYEIVEDVNQEVPVMESRIRISLYLLWKDAASQQMALHLEASMKHYFDELYEFSYGVVNYDEDYYSPRGTERMALLIIGEKEKRKKQIERHKICYERFLKIMDGLPGAAREVLSGYLANGEKVEYALLRTIMKQHLKYIESFYEDDSQIEAVTSMPTPFDIEQARNAHKQRILDRQIKIST